MNFCIVGTYHLKIIVDIYIYVCVCYALVSLSNKISYFYSFTRTIKFNEGFITHGFASTFRSSVVLQSKFTLILTCSKQNHGKESF